MKAMRWLVFMTVLGGCAQEPRKGRCWAVDGPLSGTGVELTADSVKHLERLIASGEWSLRYAPTAGHWTCGPLQPILHPERAQYWALECRDKHGPKPQSFIAADLEELREEARHLEMSAGAGAYDSLSCNLLTAKVISP